MATTIEQATAKRARLTPRRDVLTLWLGIVFSLLFTGVIWLAGFSLQSVPHLPKQDASWYYWKLADPTLIRNSYARFCVWP